MLLLSSFQTSFLRTHNGRGKAKANEMELKANKNWKGQNGKKDNKRNHQEVKENEKVKGKKKWASKEDKL